MTATDSKTLAEISLRLQKAVYRQPTTVLVKDFILQMEGMDVLLTNELSNLFPNEEEVQVDQYYSSFTPTQD